jgi:pimeloyl-ACP methyl ester carboxylesterase
VHYVSGGQGPALILIHGFPENWSAYARIMPRLASRFRVVAVDLRGIGGSTPVQLLPRHLSERQSRRAGPRVNPIVVGRAAQGDREIRQVSNIRRPECGRRRRRRG